MLGSNVGPARFKLDINPAVNRNALEVVGGRQHGLDRPMAFAVLDSELCRLSKARGVLDLYLGKALAPLLEGGYEAIGYARLSDYCAEHLPFTRRTAELLRRQALHLDRFPLVRQAFLDATINQSHARLVAAHLERSGGDERALVELAGTLTVRALKELLAGHSGSAEASRHASSGAGQPGPNTGSLEPAGRPDTGPGAAVADATDEAAEAAEAERSDAAGERRAPAGVWLHYRIGPELLADWEQIVERLSRMEESDLKPWEVLEILAAEFLSGAPLPAGSGAAASGEGASPEVDGVNTGPDQEGPGDRDRDRDRTAGSGPPGEGSEPCRGFGTRWGEQGAGPPVDRRKMLEEASACWRWLDDLPVQVDLDAELTAPVPADPRDAHDLVQKLVSCRRQLDLYIGRMLRTMDHCGLVRQAGFAGMCHYAAERLGLGGSTTARLLRRERELARRPVLFDAVVSGRILLSQAGVLLRIRDGELDAAWVAFASPRTCRAVEDAVHDVLQISNLQPASGRRRGWHPPVEGEDLQSLAASLRDQRDGPRGPELPSSRKARPDTAGIGAGAAGGTPEPASEPSSEGGLPPLPPAGPEPELSMFSQPEPEPAARASQLELEPGLSMASQPEPESGLSMASQPEPEPEPGPPMFSRSLTSLTSPVGGPGLRMFVPSDLLPVIRDAEAAASRAAGRALEPEECLVLFMAGMEATYTEFERKLQARRRRALRRARYRCQAPGCRSRRGLHVHHVIFRSHGGTDEDSNLVVLCSFHHLRGVHEGKIRVYGRAPHLIWEVGIRSGRPLMKFEGDVRIA